MKELPQSLNNLELAHSDAQIQEAVLSLSEQGKINLLFNLIKSNKKPNNPQSKPQIVRTAEYPLEIKIEAVSLAVKLNNNREATKALREKKYKDMNKYQPLSEKSIRTWRQSSEINQQQDYDQSHSARKKYRRLISPFLKEETELVQKIKERRQNAESVTRDWIIAEAKRLIANSAFKGSDG